MLRTHAPMLVERQGRQWYFDAYILPVKKGRRCGLYVLSWDTREQYLAGSSYYFYWLLTRQLLRPAPGVMDVLPLLDW